MRHVVIAVLIIFAYGCTPQQRCAKHLIKAKLNGCFIDKDTVINVKYDTFTDIKTNIEVSHDTFKIRCENDTPKVELITKTNIVYRLDESKLAIERQKIINDINTKIVEDKSTTKTQTIYTPDKTQCKIWLWLLIGSLIGALITLLIGLLIKYIL